MLSAEHPRHQVEGAVVEDLPEVEGEGVVLEEVEEEGVAG